MVDLNDILGNELTASLSREIKGERRWLRTCGTANRLAAALRDLLAVAEQRGCHGVDVGMAYMALAEHEARVRSGEIAVPQKEPRP